MKTLYKFMLSVMFVVGIGLTLSSCVATEGLRQGDGERGVWDGRANDDSRAPVLLEDPDGGLQPFHSQ